MAGKTKRGTRPGYNGCACICHQMPGVMHMMACCSPDNPDHFKRGVTGTLPMPKYVVHNDKANATSNEIDKDTGNTK